MFKFFRGLVVAGDKPPARKEPMLNKRRVNRALPLEPEPLLMVEVTEGNGDKDWDLWQDSVSLIDSQMQSLLPMDNGQCQPSCKDGDPYSSVRKRDR